MKPLDQCAALPYAKLPGGLRMMLITSRETRRWIVPKGWPKAGLAGHELAALEAYEEAGLRGKIAKESVGSYDYDKKMDDGTLVPCRVAVFPLKVLIQYIDWPEREERECLWVEMEQAAKMVDEKSLKKLLRNFDKLIRQRG